MHRHQRTTLLSALVLAGLAAAQGTAASAATPPVSGARIVAHFDLAAQQQPENIALEPDGSADVTFVGARQVARVTPQGKITVLATLPASASGSAGAMGIVRAVDGALFVNYNAGEDSGVWRIPPCGGTPVQVAALPTVTFLNGLAQDPRDGTLYATDTDSGTVWRVSPHGGSASVWASDGPGANGVKVHGGAVWVSNTGNGTILRFPIGPHGAAGPATVWAQGVNDIDDFAFTGSGDTVLAAQNSRSTLDLVRPDGTQQVVLTAADGLSNPTSVAVRGATVYVPSAAYFTGTDPNLLVAKLAR